MNLWNQKDLPEPPISTYKATDKHIDIQHLYDVFLEGKKFFADSKYLHADYAVLSRIVYRMKLKFRSAKDFKSLEKINKALDNYFQTNLSSKLQRIMDLIPSRYKEETYLPTKNMLDYILVRLQGLIKLMERIVETCKISAYLLDKRIHTGHFWKIAFVMYSLVSRVYVLAKHTAKFICDFYVKLLPFSSQLRNTSHLWLPTGYILPNDLKEWMNVDWLEIDDEVQIIAAPEIPNIMQLFDDLVEDDDVEFCDEYVMVDDDEDVEVVNEFRTNLIGKFRNSLELMRGFDMREDIGEVIEIDSPKNDGGTNIFTSGTSGESNIDNSVIFLDNSSYMELEEKESDSDVGIVNTSICIEDNRRNGLDESVIAVFDESENKQNGNKCNDINAVENNEINDPITILEIESTASSKGDESDEENICVISDTSITSQLEELPKAKKRLIIKKSIEKNDEDIIVLSDTLMEDVNEVLRKEKKNKKKKVKSNESTKKQLPNFKIKKKRKSKLQKNKVEHPLSILEIEHRKGGKSNKEVDMIPDITSFIRPLEEVVPKAKKKKKKVKNNNASTKNQLPNFKNKKKSKNKLQQPSQQPQLANESNFDINKSSELVGHPAGTSRNGIRKRKIQHNASSKEIKNISKKKLKNKVQQPSTTNESNINKSGKLVGYQAGTFRNGTKKRKIEHNATSNEIQKIKNVQEIERASTSRKKRSKKNKNVFKNSQPQELPTNASPSMMIRNDKGKLNRNKNKIDAMKPNQAAYESKWNISGTLVGHQASTSGLTNAKRVNVRKRKINDQTNDQPKRIKTVQENSYSGNKFTYKNLRKIKNPQRADATSKTIKRKNRRKAKKNKGK